MTSIETLRRNTMGSWYVQAQSRLAMQFLIFLCESVYGVEWIVWTHKAQIHNRHTSLELIDMVRVDYEIRALKHYLTDENNQLNSIFDHQTDTQWSIFPISDVMSCHVMLSNRWWNFNLGSCVYIRIKILIP